VKRDRPVMTTKPDTNPKSGPRICPRFAQNGAFFGQILHSDALYGKQNVFAEGLGIVGFDWGFAG
jgi:hypothetical protein